MAHTESATMRRTLRREVVGTIGLLADEEDFAAMRRYRTFTFDDHSTYLSEMDRLLRARDAGGSHTTVALFDPTEYADFCADEGLNADSPRGRMRFTAHLAAGPAVAYDGRPLRHLLPELVDITVRQSTWEYAQALLAEVGECADCGEDIGRAALARAAFLVTRLLRAAGPGAHHLVCSVAHDGHHLLSALHAHATADGRVDLDEDEAADFTTVLAAGIATAGAGGVVLRTAREDTAEAVCGWRLKSDRLVPLTEAEVFDAYCTDARTGDLISPESGLDYRAAPDLGPLDPGTSH
ncbi:hypothetical protein DY218_19715 [Streptomyces triticagri]|uniref:Uncharacterized protein n=1 Tax=Streptomyces triticagri TaxID=2293568 RepID=A0A372M245_9ACTN|nr:hypothetical protein [Streptomyces triticagri]RFU84998.1 hypothetical protein DY218_19715 [Streptomyces triticagri]